VKISRVTVGNNEELERKARPRLAGMRPNDENIKANNTITEQLTIKNEQLAMSG
jgi:hypothetical protein